jgi:aminocarboxymuconate-semialdehyde decarboxylase
MSGVSPAGLRCDVHAHILPASWPDLAERYGDPRWPRLEHVDRCSARIMIAGDVFRDIDDRCYSVERRLEAMDAAGVDQQVLSTVPVMFSYWAEPARTAELARHLNEHLATTVRDHPDRFHGLGTVPLTDVALAVRELERCRGELGLAGVEIGSNVAGKDLDDPGFEPFWEAAEALGASLFIHPWQAIGGSRMSRYYFLYTVAMPAETAFAFGAVVFGGVLERHPRLRLLFAHGGGSVPFILPRMERGWEVWEPARARTAQRPSAYFRRCWFDSVTWDAGSLEFLVARAGEDRVLFGTDFPFLMGEDRPGTVIESANLDDAVRAKLFGTNCAAFLGLADHAATASAGR